MIFLLLLAGCATVPLPEIPSLSSGRSLVLEHCANCHAPPRPAATLAADWPDVFEVMVKKSKINAEEARLIEMYLRAAAYEH